MTAAAADLSPRDRAVLDTLARLRVARTDQLYRLHFQGAHRQAGYRCLWRLSRLGLIRRLDRRIGGVTPGSSAAIYTLDVKGRRLTLGAGLTTGVRLRRPWTPGTSFLRHAVTVSEVYVIAVDIIREHSSADITAFEVEPKCWRQAPLPSGYLKPDAYLVLCWPTYEDSYFIEVDCGTESLNTIERKLSAYVSYYQSGSEQSKHGVFPRVVFVTLDEARARQLQPIIDKPAPKLFAAVPLARLSELLRS